MHKHMTWTLGLLPLVMWGVVVWPASEARAQLALQKESQPRPKEEVEEIKVFSLAHADVATIEPVILTVLQDENVRLSIDPRTNSIIVMGGNHELEKMEALLQVLDVPQPKRPKDTEPAVQTKVYRLQHLAAEQFSRSAEAFELDEKFNFNVDFITDQVLVSGTVESLQEFSRFVELIDTASTVESVNRQVRVLWLVNRENAASPPPKDVTSAVEKISEQLDLDPLGTAAQLLVNVSPQKGGRAPEFVSQGTAHLKQFDRMAHISIEGELEAQPESQNRLTIRIEAALAEENTTVGDSGGLAALARQQAQRDLCQLSTVVSAPLGHPVVLAVTPIDSLDSVFVIQVLDGN